VFDFLSQMFAQRGLPPHGFCLLWDPTLIWTHVISDLLIGLSYFSIPVVLATLLFRRRDVQFGWVVWLFAAFILACGLTHFLSILVLWVPAYGIEGLVKLATAIVSVVTAIALWPLLPKAIALPSPAQLAMANSDLLARVEERNAALAALQRETAERERTEAMLRQAQKMEAVGQLTGGVAHDFNNLLMIVAGNVERAHRLAEGNEKVKRALADAMAGADRAATLIQRLLAFSRRQTLQPALEDLNAIITEMAEIVKTTLGPQSELDLTLEPNLPNVMLDRGQIENVLLNLAINARDAMPDGGTLRIATRSDGTSVIVSVSDNGIGMSEEIQARIFEPFFSTKPVGQGTGLGLSQVYGFTKQSGGDIHVTSAPGEGTQIELILPRERGSMINE
jgi:signal transduction histidine kinase